ncbi:GYD domain-containing protein [Micromonospora sp. 4G57]|uniref:GYD domain-containing protein n=1 Tax=Micromonospora sicca TaxID=2202420 RepID=A0ABU5JL81_9ACTN|nr:MULTISPECIES: GYD domain-containing protein [unclassified Micromonospora]MDZ5446674.1 GYD domain-containing protein [Micromonospora sp. 4G57]MDZ5493390.1 GYD domain-containing protein [Micromonospora sp. 4G53]
MAVERPPAHLGVDAEVPKFLLQSTYTIDGLKGLITDGGTKRVEVVRNTIEASGGRLESMYFSFGKNDTYVLCELPDHKAAAALAIAIRAAGGVDSRITPVLTAEEVDEAVRAKEAYQPPGR